ncbi:MAG: hypothetical protein QM703_25895 [Gemmatales bacterium]
MAQPMPPPPPPKKGMSLLPLILVLVIAIAGLAWYKGWFTVDKDPETGKTKVNLHADAFKKDKDAFLKSAGEAYDKGKDKLASMMGKAKDAKPEDKANIDKEIDALKKQLAGLEEAKKKAEAATDDEVLKGLNDSVKKLLDPK